MHHKGQNSFIKALEKNHQLHIISEFCDPILEIAEITDRVSKFHGPALLFCDTGTAFPLLINAFGSNERLTIAFNGRSVKEISAEIEQLLKIIRPENGKKPTSLGMLRRLSPLSVVIPKTQKRKGLCQQFVNHEPNLETMPIMKCWPYDGGRFFTLPLVHTIDPESGAKNTGMYRMQVLSKNATAMHWHKHKGGAAHFEQYKKLGKRMPVSVSLGGDPVYTYAATAPLPEDINEYMLAGFIRKKAVRMVKCITNDIMVPADSDFVLEGYIDPMEPLVTEGPFGDHTGFYSLPDQYPVFHICCITHKKNAVFPATLVGIPPMEDNWFGYATEQIFYPLIKNTLAPELKDIYLPPEGGFHNLSIASLNQKYRGQAHKVMNALWGAGQMMFTKIQVMLDANVNIRNLEIVLKNILQNCEPGHDLVFSAGPSDVLDHASRVFTFSGKFGIDATSKLNNTNGQQLRENILNAKSLLSDIQEIAHVISPKNYDDLLILYLNKNRYKPANESLLHAIQKGHIGGYKWIVCLENEAYNLRTELQLWLLLNNIDPAKDVNLLHYSDGQAFVWIDGTSKTKDADAFSRDWPEIVCMDDLTIELVNAKWQRLGFKTFIPSYSNEIKALLSGSSFIKKT